MHTVFHFPFTKTCVHRKFQVLLSQIAVKFLAILVGILNSNFRTCVDEWIVITFCVTTNLCARKLLPSTLKSVSFGIPTEHAQYRSSPGLVPDVVWRHISSPVHPVKLVFRVLQVLEEIEDCALGDVAVVVSPLPRGC